MASRPSAHYNHPRNDSDPYGPPPYAYIPVDPFKPFLTFSLNNIFRRGVENSAGGLEGPIDVPTPLTYMTPRRRIGANHRHNHHQNDHGNADVEATAGDYDYDDDPYRSVNGPPRMHIPAPARRVGRPGVEFAHYSGYRNPDPSMLRSSVPSRRPDIGFSRDESALLESGDMDGPSMRPGRDGSRRSGGGRRSRSGSRSDRGAARGRSRDVNQERRQEIEKQREQLRQLISQEARRLTETLNPPVLVDSWTAVAGDIEGIVHPSYAPRRNSTPAAATASRRRRNDERTPPLANRNSEPRLSSSLSHSRSPTNLQHSFVCSRELCLSCIGSIPSWP
ncbi:hypothetical protein BDZ97DRAFT_310097 [Flammula alnicola]|nr:hypothetical protein BDZ97DRAFT_310097 [Flammula alnicola]